MIGAENKNDVTTELKLWNSENSSSKKLNTINARKWEKFGMGIV